MNYKKIKNAAGYLLVIAMILAPMMIMGHYEFKEDVLQQMPKETYNAIQEKLGGDANSSEIVDYYINNREEFK